MDKIKIAGINYKLNFIENYARDFGMLGSHCGNSNIINIDKNIDDERKQKTVIHEIFEAINYEYELKLEHEKLTVLETAIFEVLKDNKLLILELYKNNCFYNLLCNKKIESCDQCPFVQNCNLIKR